MAWGVFIGVKITFSVIFNAYNCVKYAWKKHYKFVIFDLDGALAESKQPITAEIIVN